MFLIHTPVSSAVRFLYSYSSPSINASVGQDRLEINSNTSSLKKRMLEVDISNTPLRGGLRDIGESTGE